MKLEPSVEKTINESLANSFSLLQGFKDEDFSHFKSGHGVVLNLSQDFVLKVLQDSSIGGSVLNSFKKLIKFGTINEEDITSEFISFAVNYQIDPF